LNTLIRSFVKDYNKLGDNYLQFKEFIKFEIDALYQIIDQKDKIIKHKDFEVGEYQMALKIPRQHYKHIENLRFEEIMKQRDEIIARLKKKYGVDPTKQMAQLKMPDPSLPPEQQLEMLTGGALAQQASDSTNQGAVKADPIAVTKQAANVNAPRMQKDFSIASIMSKTTADTNFHSALGDFSSVLSPSLKVGLYKNNRGGSVAKNPFLSQRNSELAKGQPPAQSAKNLNS